MKRLLFDPGREAPLQRPPLLLPLDDDAPLPLKAEVLGRSSLPVWEGGSLDSESEDEVDDDSST